MAKRKDIVDIFALLQHIRAGQSNRKIGQLLSMDRRTVQKYRKWAREEGLDEQESLPPIDELYQRFNEAFPPKTPPHMVSTVEPWGEFVKQLREKEVEIAAIYQRLGERGYSGSYEAVRRFVKGLEPNKIDATVRVECRPGEEAQVDFGYAGKLIDERDGQEKKAWAFVMTLSWSRHQYVEFVFNQKIPTWLRCHRNAFAFFGGVPERIVIDNLKAGVIAVKLDDPQIQLTYRECAEHYGFLVAPCKPRTPQHKGKVEKGGIHYVKRNFLGGRERSTLAQANRDVRLWCLTTAGQRIHGTTKEAPLVRFEMTEQICLSPLPDHPYDMAEWKTLKLHRDCHLHFDNAHYSAPFRFIGQRLRVRGGTNEVRVYTLDYQLVATHDRASQAGERLTHPAHLPEELLPGMTMTQQSCLEAAADIGPATTYLVQELFADRIVYRMPMVRRLLNLRERVGDARLEAACKRALSFGDPSYMTVKRILNQQIESVSLEEDDKPILNKPTQFVRGAHEILGGLWEGLSWN